MTYSTNVQKMRGERKPVTFFNLKSGVIFLVLLFSGFTRLCAEAPGRNANDDGTITVVTSILPLSFFVERIGGERVSVSVMVPPGGNPHTYEPTPAQMVALRKAGLFVKVGSGIEFELDWMKRFISLNPGLKICDASEGVVMRTMSPGEHGHHDHDHHDHGRLDPHYWLSPENGRRIAVNVERALATLDPPHAAVYAANRKRLDAELEALSEEIADKLSAMKQRSFMVFHPAWGYYAADFGLQQISAEEEGKELTPAALRRLVDLAKRTGIRVVFVSPRFNTLQAETIAREIGGVTEPIDPLSDDYIDNLRRATDAFVRSSQ